MSHPPYSDSLSAAYADGGKWASSYSKSIQAKGEYYVVGAKFFVNQAETFADKYGGYKGKNTFKAIQMCTAFGFISFVFAFPFFGAVRWGIRPEKTFLPGIILNSLLLYIFAIFHAIRLLIIERLQFMPSFSAFTFPFVISAIATGEAYKFLGLSALNYLFYIQAFIALILVIYVSYKYLRFLLKQ